MLDSGYYETQPNKMLMAGQIKYKKENKEKQRETDKIKKLRNQREKLEIGDKILRKIRENQNIMKKEQ